MLELTSIKLHWEDKHKAKLLGLNISEICREAIKNSILDYGSEDEKKLHEIESLIEEQNTIIKKAQECRQTLVIQKTAIEKRNEHKAKEKNEFVQKQLDSLNMAGGVSNFID